MPDEKTDNTTPDAAGGAKKGKLKLIIVVAGILVIEAGAIIGGMMLLGGPADVQASGLPDDLEALEEEKIEEIPVLEEKLANNRAGVTYIYNTEIFVQVKRKHAARVTDELEQFSNEIKADINAVWRTSDPHHFQEPKLESLTRKVTALMNDRFGVDVDTSEPIIQKAVVICGTGFRVDS